jgi:hypothetical protein
MSTHTPGPWQISASDAHVHVLGKDGEFVAECHSAYTEHRQRYLDNARLIVAAPRLLAVLRTLLTAIEHDPADFTPVTDDAYQDALAVVYELQP